MRSWFYNAAVVCLLAGLVAGCAGSGGETDKGGGTVAPYEPKGTNPPVVETPAPKEKTAPPDGTSKPTPSALSLKEQQRRDAIRRKFEAGQILLDQGRYADALKRFQEILQSDPQHPGAKALAQECRIYLGREAALNPAQEAARLETIEEQMNLARARRFMKKAQFAKKMELFKEAKGFAQEAAKRFRGIRGAEAELKEANELVAQLQVDLLAARTATADKRDIDAQKAVEEIRRLERETRRAELKQYHRLVVAALDRGDFEAAVKHAKLAQEKFPASRKAGDLREMAEERRLRWEKDRIELVGEDEWNAQFIKIRTMGIPNEQTVQFISARKWRDLTRRRRSRLKEAVETFSRSPKDAKLRILLERSRIAMDILEFNDMSLDLMIREFSKEFRFPFIIDKKAYEKDDKERSIRDKKSWRFDKGMTLTSVLDLILGDRYGYAIVNGVVFISRKEDIKGRTRLKIYDVTDLLANVPNFKANSSNIDFAPGGGGDGGDNPIRLEEEIDDDDLVEGVFGDDGGVPGSRDLQSIEDFVRKIRRLIAPESWSDEGQTNNTGFIVGAKGALMVTNTENVHRQIADLLKGLRRARSVMVTIEARFLQVRENFVEDISGELIGKQLFTGADGAISTVDIPGAVISSGSGAGPSGPDAKTLALTSTNILEGGVASALDGAIGATGFNLTYGFFSNSAFNFIVNAARAENRSSVLSAPRVTVFNNQRAYIDISRVTAFVKDTTVTTSGSGDNSTASTDPIIGNAREGIVLDVRPTVSHNLRYVTIELRASNTLVDLSNSRPLVTRPRQETGGSFGSVAIKEQEAVTITLPVTTKSVIKTTVVVPHKGTVLLGGLADMRIHEAVVEVPWFSKIPLLGFFFREKARVDFRSNLILLLRAEITILEDMEKKQTGIEPNRD